ncbi:Uncharacterised protein [Bordetella pertussis]|nr:Uncharacterised protein [Bordetella pertussis]
MALAVVQRAAQGLHGGHAQHQEPGRQESAQHGQAQAPAERRIQDHRAPVVYLVAAVDQDRAVRRLQPGKQGQHPAHRHQLPDRHHQHGQRMGGVGDPALAKQHHAQEARLDDEDRQHAVAQQGTGQVADLVHQARPEAAQLDQHRHRAGQRQHERQREDAHPEAVGGRPAGLSRPAGAQLEEQQQPGQRQRYRQEQRQKAQACRELRACQQEWRDIHDGR